MNKHTLAERLKIAMEARNFSQNELATAAGVAQPTIWRLVSGNAASSSRLTQIAQALDVSLSWLADGTGEMASKKAEDDPERRLAIKQSFSVPVYVGNRKTGQHLMLPRGWQSNTLRAYELDYHSGCALAPAGSIVIIDTSIAPEEKDLVLVIIRGRQAVYRFVDGGITGYLAVDDSRVPLTEITSDTTVLGTVVHSFISFRRPELTY